jgi:hypothetical protein
MKPSSAGSRTPFAATRKGGAWDRRLGHLPELDAFGAGIRLVINKPESHNRPGC